MAQIPRGPENLNCPLHKKPMEQVCHLCPWWTQIRGKHPQTGADLDEWNCAIALLPVLTIETAKQARSGAAATESLRNEIVTRADAPGPHVRAIGEAPPSLLSLPDR